ncbi:hypothetical protein ACLMJK_006788 [Lecanora helva]
MAPPPNKVYQVAVCLFSGADILDFAGPLEILSHTFYNNERAVHNQAFQITQIASTETILAGGLLTITPNTTFAEASKKIEDFDLLVVPGGAPALLQRMATSAGPEIQFIKAFNSLGQKGGKERTILSICTGALLVGAAGALKNLKATTHHRALEILGQIDGSIDVVSHRQNGSVGRYVDGGRNENGVRIVTAGGVSCGLDATLYIAEITAGREAAEMAARMTEYQWQRA